MPSGKNQTLDTPDGFARVKKEIETAALQRWAKERAEILIDLACLGDDSCARFRRRFPVLDVSTTKDDLAILQRRDELRRVWNGETHLGEAVSFWANLARIEHSQTWVVSAWAGGRYTVHPNYHIFSLSLAIGVGDLSHKMAICANPDCPQKYFLKGRKTQRFCDRPTCAAFGQRQHKKNWWHTHRGELRTKHENSTKRPKDSRRAFQSAPPSLRGKGEVVTKD
jgi:hypothetical protein